MLCDLFLLFIGEDAVGFGDVVSFVAFDVVVADNDGEGDAFLSAVSCASGCFMLHRKHVHEHARSLGCLVCATLKK